MTNTARMQPVPRQGGAALFTVLIMLVALTLVCLTSLSSSLLELRMSANEEATVAAFQSAQAGIDATITNSDTTMRVIGSVPNTTCFNPSGTCDNTIASMPDPVGAKHEITVTRVTDETCPPRTRDYASSCSKQHAVTFDVKSDYDDTAAGRGSAELVQGYIKLIPAIQDLESAGPETATEN